MPWASYMSVFLLALLGGLHCAAMCGGVVSALTLRKTATGRGPGPGLSLLVYHLGRIASYVLLGLLAGALGAGALPWQQWRSVQLALYGFAGVVLVYLGWRLWQQQIAWPRLERLMGKLLGPLRRQFGRLHARPGHAPRFLLGLIWGCTPCGMVYGALGLSLLAGSGLAGAALMLVFGLGTLPNLLLADRLLVWARHAVGRQWQKAGAALVVAFGVWALGRVLWFPETIVANPFCALP